SASASASRARFASTRARTSASAAFSRSSRWRLATSLSRCGKPRPTNPGSIGTARLLLVELLQNPHGLFEIFRVHPVVRSQAEVPTRPCLKRIHRRGGGSGDVFFHFTVAVVNADGDTGRWSTFNPLVGRGVVVADDGVAPHERFDVWLLRGENKPLRLHLGLGAVDDTVDVFRRERL